MNRLALCLTGSVFALIQPLTRAVPVFEQDSAKTAQTSENPPFHVLSVQPLQVESLGLTMHLPEGATYILQKSDDQTIVSISDDPNTPTWNLRIQPLIATEEKSSVAAQIEALLKDFAAKAQPFRVISNAEFAVNTGTGQLCLVERSPKDGEPFISGWLLLQTGQRTFMVFALQTLPEHLPRVRPLLESSFRTIELRSVSEIAAEQTALLESGAMFINSITPERLKSLVGLRQWHRIYKPAAEPQSVETEIGYSLLEVLEAKKGALDQTKKEADYDKGERTPGLMVRVQGRVAINPERKRYFDSIALYWMAWDQSEEAWVIRGTDRMGEAERSEAETGIRMGPGDRGGLPPTLTVIKSESRTNSREPFEWEVPDVYLSQPLGWLLGRLLPKDVTKLTEYRYYFYSISDRGAQLSLRSDAWAPQGDGRGRFQLTTKMSSESHPVVSIYNSDGDLVQRTHPDGSISELSTVESIHRIWKSKNLDVGQSRR